MQTKEKNYAIGIDVGGTKMAAVLYDGENVLADSTLLTPKDDLEKFLVMLKALTEPLLERALADKVKVGKIGLGVPGPINFAEGRILTPPNLSIISNLKLGEIFSDRVGMPVALDNDANCFVRAEALRGEGKKLKNIYGVTIGTGIGGGWWVNGEVYLGAHGGAGEPGALVVDYQSGLDLEEGYQKLMQNNGANLAGEAYRGDLLAEKAFKEFGDRLGAACANIANIIDPEIIIFGGSVAEASDLFLSRVKKSMRDFISSMESSRKIKLVKSKLGPNAGAIGAALLAMKE